MLSEWSGTSIDVRAHQTHCCKEHGCKYGDEGCPVVFGAVEQQYPCESCSYHTEDDLPSQRELLRMLRDATTDMTEEKLMEVTGLAKARCQEILEMARRRVSRLTHSERRCALCGKPWKRCKGHGRATQYHDET